MKIPIYAIIVLLLSSCSSSRVVSFYVVDEDKIESDTFSFYARNSKNLRPQQQEIDSLIELSVSKELLKAGYTNKYPSDIYISFKVFSENYVELHGNDYYSDRRYGYPIMNRTDPYSYYITEHKKGVFMLEIFDNKDKLLWQGSKAFKVKKSTNTKDLLIEYAKEVTNSFKPNL